MIRPLLLTLTLALTVAATSAAETPQVSARISRDSILIGDQFTIEVEVSSEASQHIEFAELNTDKEGAIELIKSHPVDTLKREGRRLRLIKRYTMGGFNEGGYNLGRMPVLYLDKNITDTLLSRDSLRIIITTFEIDSTSQSIYDIKPQRDLPFKYAEIGGYVRWAILGLILLALVIYGALRLAAKLGRPVGSLFKPKAKEPAHVVAIKALEELHHKKLWQSNHHKSYYSSLTDIMRNYISERYEISAMEMTSEEIIAAMRTLELPRKSEMDLLSLLKVADLVKFAKAEPEAEENERHYHSSYYFVEQTKVVESEGEDVDGDKKI